MKTKYSVRVRKSIERKIKEKSDRIAKLELYDTDGKIYDEIIELSNLIDLLR